MTYKEAKRLHSEDEVTVKSSGKPLYVINTTIFDKYVFILCDDGKEYLHTEIK